MGRWADGQRISGIPLCISDSEIMLMGSTALQTVKAVVVWWFVPNDIVLTRMVSDVFGWMDLFCGKDCVAIWIPVGLSSTIILYSNGVVTMM